MATVLLTGASGFLGAHLLLELRAAGAEVRALSRRPESDAAIAGLGGVPVRADVTDPESLRAAMKGVEAVLHDAADTNGDASSCKRSILAPHGWNKDAGSRLQERSVRGHIFHNGGSGRNKDFLLSVFVLESQ